LNGGGEEEKLTFPAGGGGMGQRRVGESESRG